LGSAPKPQRGTRSELNAVACPSSKLCFAVGGVIPTGHGNVPGAPLIERFNGARWQLEASPEATGPLDSISCSSRSACTAVGGWESFVTPSTPVYSSVAERWNGSGWSLQSFPAPAGATGAGLLGVSCLARQCGAVGSAQFTDTYAGQAEPGVDHVLVGDWVASSWSTRALPFPRGVYRGSTSAPRGWLYGISCASSRSCAAVGEYVATNGDIGPLAADWDGAAWSETALRRGPVALKSVACPSSGWCMAVGATIAERYTG